tara:strand:+ start:303 stop:776 length:474 start_codon:yes stop_codon:yes gene_type:complete
MGLDNIPYEYPCIVDGLQDPDGEIDCHKNIELSKCPWDKAMRDKGTPVYGMFGTPCWYRGKVGNAMLHELMEHGYDPPIGNDGEPLNFYGDWTDGDEEKVRPEACIELSEWMADHAEIYAKICNKEFSTLKEIMESYRYAINWLKFVSEYNGSRVWY